MSWWTHSSAATGPGYSRRNAFWRALISVAALLQRRPLGSGPLVQAAAPRSQLPSADTVAAIDRGLDWLVSRQRPDGGFGRDDSYARNVGVCALSGLALLASGGRRPFPDHVRRCTDYLLSRSQPNGFIVEEHVVTHAPLYGHGFATLFLGQVYGLDARPELRHALSQASRYIVHAQGEHGRWWYTDDPADADVSITSCQLMALCSARQAGLAISRSVVDKAAVFLLGCQNPDGGFRYRMSDPPDSLFPRSAAAVAALHAAGWHGHSALARAREYLSRSDGSSPAAGHAEYYFYGRFHATLAAWQAGGETWERWYPAVCVELLSRQSGDGSWQDSQIGHEYATAMALLTLQFPFDCVPQFAR